MKNFQYSQYGDSLKTNLIKFPNKLGKKVKLKNFFFDEFQSSRPSFVISR